MAGYYGEKILDARQIGGHGDYIGGDTRDDARRSYRAVIESRESGLAAPEHYRDSRGRGFADYWSRVAQKADLKKRDDTTESLRETARDLLTEAMDVIWGDEGVYS